MKKIFTKINIAIINIKLAMVKSGILREVYNRSIPAFEKLRDEEKELKTKKVQTLLQLF